MALNEEFWNACWERPLPEIQELPTGRCAACTRITWENFRSDSVLGEHSRPRMLLIGDFSYVSKSAFRGCQLCRIIFLHIVQSFVHTSQEFTSHKIIKHIGLRLSLDDELSLHCRNAQNKEITLSDLSVAGVLDLQDSHSPTSKSSPGASDEEGTLLGDLRWGLNDATREIELLKCAANRLVLNPSVDVHKLLVPHWLQDCLTNHSTCCQHSKGALSEMPTRVLDVGSMDSTRSCLVLTAGMNEPYLTLSHCWGTGRHKMTLTSATLKSFMSGIKDSKLPRTFKDAIMLTRNLRFRYIWIDSMCIIQPTGPSNDDWNREAARMGGYYSNSRLNLAASAGMGNAEPLLRVRMGSMIEARPFPLFEQAVHRKWTGMSEIMKRDPMWLPSVQPSIPSWLHHIQDSPLSSRAWVLQERLLAPRTLHCTMQGFMWECSELRATEYEPLGTSSDFVARDHGLLNVNVIGRREKDFIVGTYWRQVVEAFSQLQISFPSDRLPALAGIASKVQEYTDDIYIAGHFESSLLGSLLWSTLRPVTPVKVTRNAGAPSWAWASTSAPVTFASLDATDYPSRNPERIEWEAEIIDVSAQPASRQNPFSWLSLGALRIRGRLKEWKSGEDVAEIRLQDQTAEGRWWGHRPMPDGNVNQAGAIPVKRRESLVELQGPQSADSEVSKRRCDGCEKDIRGGFSSCLICPDFDYCSDCMLNASATHPEHSFKTYESDRARTAAVVASGDLLTATIEKQMTQARRTMEQIKLEEQRLESGRNHNPTIDVTLDWPDEFVAGATMYLFLIIRGIQEPSWEGLVLAPTENGRDFRRLGYFSTKASAVFQDVEIQQISLT